MGIQGRHAHVYTPNTNDTSMSSLKIATIRCQIEGYSREPRPVTETGHSERWGRFSGRNKHWAWGTLVPGLFLALMALTTHRNAPLVPRPGRPPTFPTSQAWDKQVSSCPHCWGNL